jgi:hypothetical protein
MKDPILDVDDLALPPEPRVLSLKAEEYVDSVGDPSLRVTVTLPGDPDRDSYPWEQLRPIRDEIFRVLRDRGDARFPYVRFLLA